MNIFSVNRFMEEILKLPKAEGFTYFFRGHTNSSHLLEPSIFRDDGYLENEHIFFREFVAHHPDSFLDCRHTIDYLVMMQHYELPTRLLDLTTNPLIALFFACHTLQDPKGLKLSKGEVIVFKIPNQHIKYYDSDTVSVLANIAKMNIKFSYKTLNNISKFNEQKDIKLLRHEIGMEKPHFAPRINPRHLNSVICVKAKRNNPRIQNQSGAFLLFGAQEQSKKMPPLNQAWIQNQNRLLICTPAKILEQLSSIGIDGAFIYPEMQNYAKILKGSFFKGRKTYV